MQHVNLKLFAGPASSISLHDAIPVFHRWIQEHWLPELLIDVTDYKHVPSGPGVLLIAHEANYSLDMGGNRLGLLYARKAVLPGSPEENLRQAYASARKAAERLQEEPEFKGKLWFSDHELEVTLNDRLLFPNGDDTWNRTRSDLTAFFDGVLGAGQYSLERASDLRERFRVHAARAVVAPSGVLGQNVNPTSTST